MLLVKLTYARVELKHLNVTITGLEVQKANQSGRYSVWIPLSFMDGKKSAYVGILALQNITKYLSAMSHAAENYNALRMDLSTAEVTYKDNFTFDLIVSPSHIDVITHLEIKFG